ncbi:kinase [Leifsonia sp. ZF2019]|uniref:AAA family ATPase n=1 Tax=Leifsonia sp. ZF2019 TaxID=2781978 RepID=UPI001CBAF951|nr:AAA family ATPase [Leifsonia sp. ZF2019]UAJ80112.1 kinase [Leifsonia sp. ZF2019]
MSVSGVLVVLRGNAGSGKSTVARLVQQRLPAGRCLVVSQDHLRRDMLREPDVLGANNAELLKTIAEWGLARGLLVVVEGILDVRRYQHTLERLRERSWASHFFAWDLSLEETIRRHGQRPKAAEFGEHKLRDWYHGWQPLAFAQEVRIDKSVSAEAAAALVLNRVNDSSGHG